MASSARIDEIKKKFDENPRRYFAPLANEFRKAGDLEQAIIICEEFLPQQAGHMSGHIVYGQALYESGRLPESRTVFETALGLDPENLIALRHLGDIARSQGEMGAARQWYDRVLEADPRNEEIQGIIGGLTGSDAAAGAVGQAEDITLVMEAIPAASLPPGPPPELAAIDLDMDADFSLPSAPAAPAGASAPAPPASALLDEPYDALPLDGLQPTNAEAATAAGMPDARDARAAGLEPSEFEAPTEQQSRAPGLEPAEFEAPSAAPPRADGLQSSEFPGSDSGSSVDDSLMELETSFSPGTGSGAPSNAPPLRLDGLEPTGATQPPARDLPAFPSMDPGPDASQVPSSDNVLLGAESPSGPRDSRSDLPSMLGAMPLLDAEASEDARSDTSQAERSLDGLPMMELTPAVIAAESKLMDAGQAYDSAAAGGRDDVVSGSQPPFVTETMAELYLKQGFREQALDVYRQLAAASPSDVRLAARVEELDRASADSHGAAAVGPTVRDFFHRLATRRPGERGAEAAPPARDDFAPVPSVTPEPVAAAVPLPGWEPTPPPAAAATSEPVGQRDPEPTPMPSAAARGAAAQGRAVVGGTIDALFGTRAASRSEDSAASALAQAFGGTSEAPAITGRPARAAAQELSLDSVFRDGPARAPRASQSFSFDQFFSESATTSDVPAGRAPDAGPTGEPAERTADDIQQFNSWLQGLKQR